VECCQLRYFSGPCPKRQETDQEPSVAIRIDDTEDEKCLPRCRHSLVSLFPPNLCRAQQTETTSEPIAVVQEIDAPYEGRRSFKSYFPIDCCCTKPAIDPDVSTEDAAEENHFDCGRSLAACLDCFCYQPQVRTIPSAYGSEGTVVTVQQNTHRETVIILQQDIVSNLYLEVRKDFEMGLEDDRYEQSCSQQCDQAIKAFFETFTCKFPNPFSEEEIKPKKEVMTKTLLKAKDKGFKMMRGIGFSFLEDFSKHIFLLWVIPEFVLGLIGCIASIATVSLEQNKVFNFLHLSLIILATCFGTFDFFETLFKSFKHYCKKCSCCKKKIKEKVKKDTSDEQEASEEEDATEDDAIEEGITTDEATDEGITNIDEVSDEEELISVVDDKVKKCSCYRDKCRPCCRNATDAIRIILTEIILYPLLICDIFEVTTGRGFEGTSHSDRLGVFLFVVSCIYLLLYVYIARIIIMVGLIRNITDIRTPERKIENKDARNERHYNRNIRRSAVVYQVCFTVHMILQMIAQVLMFIAIGGKIRYDNRHFYDSDDPDQSIYVSGYLWFMIISGFFLPFMGFLSFFVVTFYWTQEFPIGIYVDMISLMKMTACGGEEIVKFGEKIEERKEYAQKLCTRFETLHTDYHNMRKVSWYEKFSYPFVKPGLILLCMLYASLLLAFITCAALTLDEAGDITILILNGGGWAIYYLLAVIFGVIANIYILLVVAFWVIVITTILVLIAVAVAVLSVTMWCYFACICFERYKNHK
jgi:hypothetical protein